MRVDVPSDRAGDPFGFAAETLAPAIMSAASGFARSVYQYSRLSLREFEAARARTADINGCIICQGFRAGRDIGAMFAASDMRPQTTVADNGPAPDEAFYAALPAWRTSRLFSEREALAIEFAECFGTEPKALAVDEAFWTRMRAAFSDAEICDLAHCVAAWVGLGRVAHVLGFDQVCLPFTAPADMVAQ